MTDLDMQGLLPSLFALVGTLAGTFGGILTGSRLTTYRLEQLEKKVEKQKRRKGTFADAKDTVIRMKNSNIGKRILTSAWAKAAAIRALKTVAQTAAATIGTSAILSDVDWRVCLSAAVLAGILSLLTSVAGLPEVTE